MDNRTVSRKELARENSRKNRKRKNLRLLMIAAVTALLLYITGIYGASLAYFGDFISSGTALIQIGSGWPVEGDFSAFLQGEGMGTSMCLLTDDSLQVYSPTGKRIFDYSHNMQAPAIAASSNRVAIYDLNQTSLKVANAHTILFHRDMQNSITHVAISDSNRIAVTGKSSSYNGEVAVYNYDMSKQMVWYCAKGYPVYSSLSDNGKQLAVTALQTRDGLLESIIYLIDCNKGEELFSITGGAYPLTTKFVDKNKLLIAYSDKLVLWDTKNNASLGEFSFGGDSLLAIEYKAPYIAVAYGGYNKNQGCKISLIGDNFTRQITVEAGEEIKDLSLSSSRIYALGMENLYEFDYTGQNLKTEYVGELAKQLVTFNGTMAVSSTQIDKLEKTKSR